MKRVARPILTAAVWALLTSSVLRAQTTLTPQISGNTLTARIDLPGGVGADLTITFENVSGLDTSALTLTASLVNPSDSSLLSRLPDATALSVPAGFPVLLRVDPSDSSALSFTGVYQISFYTQNLIFQSGWRLLKAPDGGPFDDITSSLSMGSVRVAGGGGGMSEFLIVADTRPIDGVINGKFDALTNLLTSYASSMPAAVFNDLRSRLSNARNLYAAGSITDSMTAVQGFADAVQAQSGSAIPNVWTAGASSVNVAGLLRSGAGTLKFSLAVKSNQTP